MNAEKHVRTEFALEKSNIDPKVPVEEPTMPKQSLGGGLKTPPRRHRGNELTSPQMSCSPRSPVGEVQEKATDLADILTAPPQLSHSPQHRVC